MESTMVDPFDDWICWNVQGGLEFTASLRIFFGDSECRNLKHFLHLMPRSAGIRTAVVLSALSPFDDYKH